MVPLPSSESRRAVCVAALACACLAVCSHALAATANDSTGSSGSSGSSGRSPQASDYLIGALPLLSEQPSFKQYAGYMPINNGSTEMFFWFVESQGNPATDPVILWLNGGASSIGYGFWTEHGPFRLRPNASGVDLYPYSWNRIASVIYLEAPSGVGFSWSADTKHYTTDDAQASWDNYQFLLAFFAAFPQFKSNPFYLTGESYGGHYIPTLAERMIDNENDINMKGFLIGNPGINSDWYFNINEYAFQTFLWSHGLLPHAAYQASVTACGWGAFFTDCAKDFTHPTAECKAATDKALKYAPTDYDVYDVLAKTCQDGFERVGGAEGDAVVAAYTPFLARRRERSGANTTYNPCISRWTAPYLNRPDVLKAIHADAHYNRKWPSHPPSWQYGDETADIALLFPKFFSKRPDWRILVVSGTADAAVPFMGTERWIECLGRPVVKDWRNWRIDGDIAGSAIDYDHISLVTVKGCGHTIPTYCPEAGYQFFENWLDPSRGF